LAIGTGRSGAAIDPAALRADLVHDRFHDHFDRSEVRTQRIEIRRVEQLQLISAAGRLCSCRVNPAGSMDDRCGARSLFGLRGKPILS
jgi:hypothetical protein